MEAYYILSHEEAEALGSGDARKVDQLRVHLRERFRRSTVDVEITHPDGWVWIVIEIEGQA